MIADAEAAAHIEGLEGIDPRGFQPRHQLDELHGAPVIRLDLGDLRADVHRQPPQLEQRLGADALGDSHDLVVGYAELRRLLSGLRVGVRFGGDVGIDADADARGLADSLRRRDHGLELGRRLDVQKPNARANRLVQLDRRLPHSGEHDGIGVEPPEQGPAQLAY